MVTELTPDAYIELRNSGKDVVLIDVLPRKYFLKQHLPGAINVPMDTLQDMVPTLLTAHQHIVVYCFDAECKASTKGAAIIEELGCNHVYDIAAGIEGWKAEGNHVYSVENQ